MAKRQYRVTSTGEWTSNQGYSFIALLNQSGSGKKITLRQLSVFVMSHKGAAAATCTARLCQSATPFVGESMVAHAAKLDSSATLPSTVVVRRGVMVASLSARGTRVDLVRRGGAVGTQNNLFACSANRSGARHLFGGAYNRGATRGNTAVEPLTIPQDTGYALVVDNTMSESQPVRVNVVASVNGKTVVWDFVAVPAAGTGLFSIENTSTDTVKLLSYSFAELGTSDTPFIRVVPIGQNYAADLVDSSKVNFTVEKMDSTYPDLTALRVMGDVGFIPQGSPEVVINEGSTGSPKGVNYLHTRDFNGPAFRVLLPEMRAGSGVGGSPMDMLGHANSHRASDLLLRRRNSLVEGIALNPGEGLALVASSETYVGVQPAYSGWPALSFQVLLDAEPSTIPSIAISGMAQGSRWRVERVSDSTLVATGVADVTGATSFLYTEEDTPLNLRLRVRKASAVTRYKPVEVTFNLTSAGASIPVSQISDE